MHGRRISRRCCCRLCKFRTLALCTRCCIWPGMAFHPGCPPGQLLDEWAGIARPHRLVWPAHRCPERRINARVAAGVMPSSGMAKFVYGHLPVVGATVQGSGQFWLFLTCAPGPEGCPSVHLTPTVAAARRIWRRWRPLHRFADNLENIAPGVEGGATSDFRRVSSSRSGRHWIGVTPFIARWSR